MTFRGSTFSPGNNDGADIGTLNMDMGLYFGYDSGTSTKASLDIEATDSSTVDVLAVTGSVYGTGTCDVIFNLPVPSKSKFDIISGVNLTFLTTSSISGSFSSISMSPNMPANVASHYSFVTGTGTTIQGDIITHTLGTGTSIIPGTAATLVLTGTCWTGHDGDTNLDDLVDVLDLANMANNFGRDDADVTWLSSDYNIDGLVDVLDLAKMANTFGWSSGSGGSEAVPEPFTVAILAVGAVGILRRRRR